MTSEALNRLRGLAEKATAGPWRENRHEVLIGDDWANLVVKPNADYVAALCPEVVLALVAEIEALRAR